MLLYGLDFECGTQKALIVCAEKGQSIELFAVDILKGEDRLPEHLLRHPFGELPVLEDEGFLVYESRAIMRYLDQRLPGPSLTPSDIKLRALMEQWISVEQSYLGAAVHDIFSSTSFYQRLAGSSYPAPAAHPAVSKALLETARVLDVLENTLKKQEYLVGSAFSLAEVTFLPTLQYLMASPGGELMRDRPSVMSWWQRISTRPYWAQIGRVVGQSARSES